MPKIYICLSSAKLRCRGAGGGGGGGGGEEGKGGLDQAG